MNIRKIPSILLLLVAVNLSCNKINKNQLWGEWSTVPVSDSTEFYSLKFDSTRVKLIDNYTFIESGNYNVLGNNLVINIKNRDKIETKISDFKTDSMTIFKSMYYKNLDPGSLDFESYDLLNIKSDKKLNYDDSSPVFHFYKKNDSAQIRYGYRIIDFNEIPRVIYGMGHSIPHQVSLFIGEGINLKELKTFYYQLTNCHIKKVNIIVRKIDIRDYRIITDYIEIFDDDFENYFEGIPTIKRIEKGQSRTSYAKNNVEIVTIESGQDLVKLDDLLENENYLLSIRNKLNIKDYLKLKKRVLSMKKTQKLKIRTEIM